MDYVVLSYYNLLPVVLNQLGTRVQYLSVKVSAIDLGTNCLLSWDIAQQTNSIIAEICVCVGIE